MKLYFRIKNHIRCLIWCAVAVSFTLNLATIYWDIFPFISKRLNTPPTITTWGEDTTSSIIDASIAMATSPHVTMVWDEPVGISENLVSIIKSLNKTEFYTYNYPRAYLYYGIAKVLQDPTYVDKRHALSTIMETIVDSDGTPLFKINRIDQIPFSLAALYQYKINGDHRYIDFTRIMYDYIQESIKEDGILLYRPGQKTLLNDALGMSVPFLVEYYKFTGDKQALQIARTQLQYYIRYGIDKKTGIPAHAIDMRTGVKIGSANWGRGIGWYYLALSYFHHQTNEFESEYTLLTNTLLELRTEEGLWTQFPGSDNKFDASSSTMFLYGMLLNKSGNINKEEALTRLASHIKQTGEILQTSGDTYRLNNYSETFGLSELSQGILMLILALPDTPQKDKHETSPTALSTDSNNHSIR